MLRIEERLKLFRKSCIFPKVARLRSCFPDRKKMHFGIIVMKLKPWDENLRKKKIQVQAVIRQNFYARTAEYPEEILGDSLREYCGYHSGYGMGHALDLNVQDKLGAGY